MEIRYVKRYQMMFDFATTPLPAAVLPDDFVWVPWHPRYCDIHGRVKYLSFRNDLDGVVFPTFTRFDACLRLMRSIASNVGFLPKTTWLIAHRVPISHPNNEDGLEYCATIQGLRTDSKTGGIQNVAVRPEFRRHGLGRALVLKALAGFCDSGCQKVTLEATAENFPAVHLYWGIGFETIRTVYKEAFLH